MIDDKENLLRRIEKLIDVHRIYIYDHKKNISDLKDLRDQLSSKIEQQEKQIENLYFVTHKLINLKEEIENENNKSK